MSDAPERVWIKPVHEAADAFWAHGRENGETHKHGYYESTWGAINAALKVAGVASLRGGYSRGFMEGFVSGFIVLLISMAILSLVLP